jgi:hypothetical protein
MHAEAAVVLEVVVRLGTAFVYGLVAYNFWRHLYPDSSLHRYATRFVLMFSAIPFAFSILGGSVLGGLCVLLLLVQFPIGLHFLWVIPRMLLMSQRRRMSASAVRKSPYRYIYENIESYGPGRLWR